MVERREVFLFSAIEDSSGRAAEEITESRRRSATRAPRAVSGSEKKTGVEQRKILPADAVETIEQRTSSFCAVQTFSAGWICAANKSCVRKRISPVFVGGVSATKIACRLG